MSTEIKAQRVTAAALQGGRELDRWSELYLAIEALTADDFRQMLGDPEALKEMIRKTKHLEFPQNSILFQGLVNRWLALDPEAVMKWIPAALDSISPGEPIRDAILEAVAKKRPEQLLALAALRKPGKDHTDILHQGLLELARQSPAKARAWLEGWTEPTDRKVAERAIRIGTLQADPLRGVELATACTNREDARTLIGVATLQAAKMGPGVLRQLATTPMPAWMLASALQQFGYEDPELAVDLAVKATGESEERQSSLGIPFAALARRNLEKARARSEELTGPMRARAMQGVASEWAINDPPAALAWLAGQKETDPTGTAYNSNAVLLGVWGGWAARDLPAAKTWADTLPPGDLRNRAQSMLSRVLSTQGDFAGATQVLASLGSTVDSGALSLVAQQWARTDPQGAAEWAITQPTGPLQNKAIANVVSSWANQDPVAAQNWLAQFPPGAARDRSIASFLNRANSWSTDPNQQIAEFNTWFDLIEDPWQRALAAQRLYWTKAGIDSDEARRWLASLPNIDAEIVRKTLRQP